jgi:deazaflavin-dependent oxidoreductase (nitroreductase family)
MATTYELTLGKRLANAAMRAALRFGLAPSRYSLLTVRGRSSGKPLSTPVIVLTRGGERFLVSPYGQRAWVKNARAAGRVALSRGGRTQTFTIEELGAEDAAPVLQQYWQETPITRPYFAVPDEADLAAFADEAARHPVFRLSLTDR